MKNLKKLIPVAVAVAIIVAILIIQPGSCMCVTSPDVYGLAHKIIDVTDEYLSIDTGRLDAEDRIMRYLERAEAETIEASGKDHEKVHDTLRDIETLYEHFVNGAGDTVLIADRNQLAYDIGIPEKTDY